MLETTYAPEVVRLPSRSTFTWLALTLAQMIIYPHSGHRSLFQHP
ncbi:hypothetical protein ACIBO9_28650 [Streptomyces prunicolor]